MAVNQQNNDDNPFLKEDTQKKYKDGQKKALGLKVNLNCREGFEKKKTPTFICNEKGLKFKTMVNIFGQSYIIMPCRVNATSEIVLQCTVYLSPLLLFAVKDQ